MNTNTLKVIRYMKSCKKNGCTIRQVVAKTGVNVAVASTVLNTTVALGSATMTKVPTARRPEHNYLWN